MKIIDLEGKEITITDLPLALMQADDYRHYRGEQPVPAPIVFIQVLGRLLPKTIIIE
jgi:hypothetical protein